MAQAFEAYSVAAKCIDVRRPKETPLEYLSAALKQLEACRDATDKVKQMAEKEWDRTRHARDPKKDGSSSLLRQRGARVILSVMTRSSAFQKKFVRDARRAVDTYRRGGAFPGGA